MYIYDYLYVIHCMIVQVLGYLSTHGNNPSYGIAHCMLVISLNGILNLLLIFPSFDHL